MATLEGRGVATLWGLADHTYVRCPDGYAWGCWGRKSGGKAICSGGGSSAQANCLSFPLSTAGLVYGVTGVCHQTANRILWPAGITVCKAKGYWASFLAYGTYGKDVPAWLIRVGMCSASSGDMPPCGVKSLAASSSPAAEVGGVPADPKDLALVRDIKRLYLSGVSSQEHKRRMMIKGTGDLKTLGGEVELVMKHRLGRTTKGAKIKNIQNIQMELFSAKEETGKRLLDGSISGEELAQEINAAINKSLKDCLKALGGDEYSRLFGLKPDETINVVDPKIAAKASK